MQPGDADNSRRTWTLLAVVLALVIFVCPLAIPFPLLDPDEGLHAAIAQEMAKTGDWLTPRFIGRPFLDKPALYFWAQAASLRLFGPSEAAIRLPGLMFGLLGAVTAGLLGWRMFDRCGAGCQPVLCITGWIAFALYATTIFPAALAQAASHDVALIPSINLALLLLWESDRAATRRATVACLTGAGLFVGLTILAKGLLGVAVVGLAYGGYLLITRRIRPATALHGATVLAVAFLTAAPWYVLVERQNPGYLHYFFLERHLLGFATDSQPHGGRPWWYYLPILLGGGLPWIAYLPIVVQDALARRRDSCVVGAAVELPQPERGGSATSAPTSASSSGAMPLLWCWLIGWTLLMTLSGSKMATYIWPVFPAIALLAATAWSRLIDGTLGVAACRSFQRNVVWASWSGPLVLPAVALAVQTIFAVRFAWPVWMAVVAAAAVAPLPLIPWRAGRRQASLAAAVLSVALQLLAVMALLLPPVAETFSARDLALHFNRQGALPPRLLVAEERIGSLVFYLDPSLRAALGPDQIQSWVVNEPSRLRPGDVIAVPECRLSQVQKILDLDGKPFQTVGRYRLYRAVAFTVPSPARGLPGPTASSSCKASCG